MKINLEDWVDNSTSSSGIWSAMKQGYAEGLDTERDDPPPPTTSASEVINKLGKDGWELISVVRAVPSVSDYFYLKRPLK